MIAFTTKRALLSSCISLDDYAFLPLCTSSEDLPLGRSHSLMGAFGKTNNHSQRIFQALKCNGIRRSNEAVSVDLVDQDVSEYIFYR